MTRSGVAITFAGVLSLVVPTHAQTPSSGPQAYRPTQGRNNTMPCDRLPVGAVTNVLSPFDRYMRFVCFEVTGQGLGPVENFHWADPRGFGIVLSAGSAAIRPDSDGQVRIRLSWYTKLIPVALSPKDQQALRKDFEQAIVPKYLTGTTILELNAVTSNAEDKRIYLIIADTGPKPPKWLVGLECNGACFRDDRQPLMFFGEPNQ